MSVGVKMPCGETDCVENEQIRQVQIVTFFKLVSPIISHASNVPSPFLAWVYLLKERTFTVHILFYDMTPPPQYKHNTLSSPKHSPARSQFSQIYFYLPQSNSHTFLARILQKWYISDCIFFQVLPRSDIFFQVTSKIHTFLARSCKTRHFLPRSSKIPARIMHCLPRSWK